MRINEALQTGKPVGHWKRKDPHPEDLTRWFWRYRRGREVWVTLEGLAKREKSQAKASAKAMGQAVKDGDPDQIPTRRCAVCGVVFQTRHTRRVCCSGECTKERNEERARERLRSVYSRESEEVSYDPDVGVFTTGLP